MSEEAWYNTRTRDPRTAEIGKIIGSAAIVVLVDWILYHGNQQYLEQRIKGSISWFKLIEPRDPRLNWNFSLILSAFTCSFVLLFSFFFFSFSFVLWEDRFIKRRGSIKVEKIFGQRIAVRWLSSESWISSVWTIHSFPTWKFEARRPGKPLWIHPEFIGFYVFHRTRFCFLLFPSVQLFRCLPRHERSLVFCSLLLFIERMIKRKRRN